MSLFRFDPWTLMVKDHSHRCVFRPKVECYAIIIERPNIVIVGPRNKGPSEVCKQPPRKRAYPGRSAA